MKFIGFGSSKGGVAKTTSAIHFAYWMALKGVRTVLVDDTSSRTALKWAARARKSEKFEAPFEVVPMFKLVRAAQRADMIVLDIRTNIDNRYLRDLAEDCDLVIIPTKPDIDSAVAAAETARKIVRYSGIYRMLLTDCPTGSNKAGEDMQADLEESRFSSIQQRIRRSEGIRHASLDGTTVAQQTGNYRVAWEDYQVAFEEIYEIVK